VNAVAARQETIGALTLTLAAPTIWAAHFFLIYGIQTLLCTGSGAGARGELLLPLDLMLTVAAMAALLYIAGRSWPSGRAHQATEGVNRSSFWRATPAALAALAMIGILWVALPPMLLPACTPSGA
jgi:hypothetical protein